MSTTIATDGSCIGNPGPGAYAIVVQNGTDRFEMAYPVLATTVGEMEVRGLLEALLFVADNGLGLDVPVTIKCDAQYVVNGFNEWMAGWEAKGWHKKGGLAHAALWKEIARAKELVGTRVRVEWVRAHQTNGCLLNARADDLANGAARSQRPFGPKPLQTTLDGVFSRLAAAGCLHIVSGNPTLEPVSRDELIRALSEARDMIDSLAEPNDTGAESMSIEIGELLERARAA